MVTAYLLIRGLHGWHRWWSVALLLWRGYRFDHLSFLVEMTISAVECFDKTVLIGDIRDRAYFPSDSLGCAIARCILHVVPHEQPN